MKLHFLSPLGLLLALLASGCTPPRIEALCPPPADQQLFVAALEALDQASQSQAFDQLRQEFPESAWAARAELIQGQIAARERATAQLSRQRQNLTRLNQQLERLEQEKALLQGDLAKLKQLLIDNELRTR
jgi:hypothetical protein